MIKTALKLKRGDVIYHDGMWCILVNNVRYDGCLVVRNEDDRTNTFFVIDPPYAEKVN